MTSLNGKDSGKEMPALKVGKGSGQGDSGRQVEMIEQGQLYFLWHPHTRDTFSGYGLTLQDGRKDLLAGLLMVDRPQPVDLNWLRSVEDTFGGYALLPMTATGERGIVCHMRIERESWPYVRQVPLAKSEDLHQALSPLLAEPPLPHFRLKWDGWQNLWTSEFIQPFDLPDELREVFERTGPGCAATETNLGVVHVCHADNRDIESFMGRPVIYQWQLARMPTAPILRLRLSILDQPLSPYVFESFLNVGQEDNVRMLDTLSAQEHLYLAFYGHDFKQQFTKVIGHSVEQQEQLQRLGDQAKAYWSQLPTPERDFDRAKLEFQSRFPL